MCTRVWFKLTVAVTVLLLLLGTSPTSAGAKNDFTYFAEMFNLFYVDSAGIQTIVIVTAVDRPTTSDQISLQIERTNPECSPPNSGCPYILFSGSSSMLVAERDVRIQPNLQWARVSTTIPFVDSVSGTSCAATLDMTWSARGEFFPEGENDQGFRKATAAGTVSCAGEEFLDGHVDSGAEIARFIVPGS